MKYIGLTIAERAVSLTLAGLFLAGECRLAGSMVVEAPAEKIQLLAGNLGRWPE